MERVQSSKPSCLYFDDLIVDCQNFRLQKGGEIKALTPRAFDVLLFLIENRDRVVEKQELFEQVWKEAFVTDNALTRVIKEIRRATGDDAVIPRYVETVPKRGYRFLAEISELSRESASEVVREHTKASITVEQWTEKVDKPGTSAHDAVAERATEEAKLQYYRITRTRIGVACLLLLGLSAAGFYLWRANHPKPTPPIKIIAVLPFKPLIAGNRDEALELGMAEAMIIRLSNIKQITVRPISAVRRYMSLQEDPVNVGREQKVDAVLDASMQRAGDKLRVSARLILVDDGATLWADQFDEKFTDIFTVQDAIAARLTNVLALSLTNGEKEQIAKHYTNNLEAYQLYVTGRSFHGKGGKEALKSVDYFQKAITLDPDYALAYAGLADSYIIRGNSPFMSPISPDDFTKARAAAVKALEIDESLAEAHTSLGAVLDRIDYDWAGAEREFKRAIELNPNYAIAHSWYAIYLEFVGQPEQAVVESSRAVAIDPLSLSMNLSLGIRLVNARRYDQAIEQGKKTLELDANHAGVHQMLGNAYEQKGMFEAAITEINKEMSLFGKNPGSLASLAHIYATAGDKSEARKILGELLTLSKQGAVSPFFLAIANAGLGDKGQAFQYLERAYEERNSKLVEITVDPRFDGLRSDARFLSLLRRIGRA